MRLLRINMADESYRFEDLQGEDSILGGRALTNSILTGEVPPQCDPLGPRNKLIFASGPMAGCGVSSGGRLSVGCKSPLTRGVKEANAGGIAADAMARQGIRGIVLEEQASQDKLYLLLVEETGVNFIDARDLAGLGNFALAERLFARYGSDYAILSVGPAGEYGMLGSGIAATDMFLRQSRMAARGGIGAVMAWIPGNL